LETSQHIHIQTPSNQTTNHNRTIQPSNTQKGNKKTPTIHQPQTKDNRPTTQHMRLTTPMEEPQHHNTTNTHTELTFKRYPQTYPLRRQLRIVTQSRTTQKNKHKGKTQKGVPLKDGSQRTLLAKCTHNQKQSSDNRQNKKTTTTTH
jgi:hypothetical protein